MLQHSRILGTAPTMSLKSLQANESMETPQVAPLWMQAAALDLKWSEAPAASPVLTAEQPTTQVVLFDIRANRIITRRQVSRCRG